MSQLTPKALKALAAQQHFNKVVVHKNGRVVVEFKQVRFAYARDREYTVTNIDRLVAYCEAHNIPVEEWNNPWGYHPPSFLHQSDKSFHLLDNCTPGPF